MFYSCFIHAMSHRVLFCCVVLKWMETKGMDWTGLEWNGLDNHCCGKGVRYRVLIESNTIRISFSVSTWCLRKLEAPSLDLSSTYVEGTYLLQQLLLSLLLLLPKKNITTRNKKNPYSADDRSPVSARNGYTVTDALHTPIVPFIKDGFHWTGSYRLRSQNSMPVPSRPPTIGSSRQWISNIRWKWEKYTSRIQNDHNIRTRSGAWAWVLV